MTDNKSFGYEMKCLTFQKISKIDKYQILHLKFTSIKSNDGNIFDFLMIKFSLKMKQDGTFERVIMLDKRTKNLSTYCKGSKAYFKTP